MKSTTSVGKSIFAVTPHIRTVELNPQIKSMITIESFLKIPPLYCQRIGLIVSTSNFLHKIIADSRITKGNPIPESKT